MHHGQELHGGACGLFVLSAPHSRLRPSHSTVLQDTELSPAPDLKNFHILLSDQSQDLLTALAMASGLEVAAGAAQVISLAFQLFQGCIEAYKFCHTAQLIGQEGDLLRTKLQIECYRLEQWAVRAKLDTTSPDERLNWLLIYDILTQQQTILTSAEKLKTKYGLDLPEIKSKSRARDDVVGETKSPHGLDRILRGLQPKLYANLDPTSSKTIASANGPIKRLQWAAGGRDRVIKVIDDLGQLNSELERLLDLPDRTWLQHGMSALLRDALSRSTDMVEVETLQQLLRPSVGVGDAAIASAAKFKRIRLVLGVDQRPDEVRPPRDPAIYDTMPRLRTFKEKKLTDISNHEGQSVQTATFENADVMVEWRTTDEKRCKMLQTHMQTLALLLGTADNTFASLHCLGLSVAKDSLRFGLVYDVPRAPSLRPNKQRDIRNLYDLILSGVKCSLEDRIRIGLKLAEAVLQLHTAGWLHKSIRSSNIVFVGGAKDSDELFLTGSPYLVGYDYARPESETNLTQLPDAPLYTELYRHPSKRGHVATGFKKRFDLYALGCLLLELALWEPLVNIISRYTEKDWFKVIVEAEASKKDVSLPSFLELVQTPAFAGEVKHAAGPSFLDSIAMCITGDSKEDEDVSLSIQKDVVDKLRECNV